MSYRVQPLGRHEGCMIYAIWCPILLGTIYLHGALLLNMGITILCGSHMQRQIVSNIKSSTLHESLMLDASSSSFARSHLSRGLCSESISLLG